MVGLPGLHQRPARPVAAPGPARDLLEQLEGALGGARVAEARPMSASITPTSVRCGKLWPLATSWVPITMSTSPSAMASSSARSRSVPPGKSLDSTTRAPAGEQPGDLLGDALDPRPAGDQRVERAAGGQAFGRALDVAAMVAHQRAAEAVLDQPGRAVRAVVAVRRRRGTASAAHSRAG